MAPVYEQILPHAAPFAAVICRLAGLFVFAPVLGSIAIPGKAKALLALAMALVVYPTVDTSAQLGWTIDLMTLVPLVVGEMLIGTTIGLIVSIPVVSVQMGGLLMGQQMGLGIANVFNPAVDTEGDILGQILLYLALAGFLTVGGLEAAYLAIAESFAHVPIGGFATDRAPLDLIVGLTNAGYELALRVAAPVMCILFLETLVIGFLMKTVPQLNILSFGFPIKILAGLTTLITAISVVAAVMHAEVLDSIVVMFEWVRSLGAE